MLRESLLSHQMAALRGEAFCARREMRRVAPDNESAEKLSRRCTFRRIPVKCVWVASARAPELVLCGPLISQRMVV